MISSIKCFFGKSNIDRVHYIDRKWAKGRLSLIRTSSSIQEYKNILESINNPIVIGGCARSGTTLLLSLLSSHPKIYSIPYETRKLCPNAYDPDPLNSGIDKEIPFYIDFIYRHLSEVGFVNREEVRWCEKTPMNVHFIGKMIDFFGNEFKFINLVRDGRNVVTSQHPQDPESYWVSPERWIRDVSVGRAFEERDEVITIRYEDLVEDYKLVARKICSFIEEKYSNSIDKYPETSDIKKSNAWFGKAKGVRKKPKKRWAKKEHSKVVKKLMNNEKAVDHLRYYEYIDV